MSHPNSPLRKTRRTSGFTLIELSVSLAIIAFIIGGGLSIAVASIERKPLKTTVEKLETIEKALLEYRRAFGRLPCPGYYNITQTNANFGFDKFALTGNCTAVANQFQENAAQFVVSGIVPVRTLGLDDTYALDGWGRKISYTVDSRLTTAGAFITYPITDTAVPTIVVNGAGGSVRTSNAAYVLISHGKSGDGAWWMGSAKQLLSNNAAKMENCECTYNAGLPPTIVNVDRFFFQLDLDEHGTSTAPPYTGFDDIVSYKTRAQLRSLDE